jgi:hypothetical protein
MKFYVVVFFLCIFVMQSAIAVDANSGYRLAKATPISGLGIHLEHVVRGAQEYDLDLLPVATSPVTLLEKNIKLNSCHTKAPQEQGADKRVANVTHSKPPSGYEGVLAWVNAVNYGTGAGYGLVRKLNVWGIDPAGGRHLVSNRFVCRDCWNAEDKVFGWSMSKSLWNTGTWFRPNAAVFEVQNYTSAYTGTVKIPTATRPTEVFHFWTAQDPRPKANPTWRYEVEAEVLIMGAAMIQIGGDFYTLTAGGINVEAFNSSWVCSIPGNNWQTIRIGL